MADKILQSLGPHAGTLLTVMLVLMTVYTALVIYWLIVSRKMFRRYDAFMRGRDAESLEDEIAELIDKVDGLERQDVANKDVMRAINRNLVSSFQKTGLVKYNAFEGMGGQASFALTLLDLNNNGFVINVIHSRNTCYTYLKEIHAGQAEVVLGEEERESLLQAMKNRNRFYDDPGESLND